MILREEGKLSQKEQEKKKGHSADVLLQLTSCKTKWVGDAAVLSFVQRAWPDEMHPLIASSEAA
jgi:hypothetical protein